MPSTLLYPQNAYSTFPSTTRVAWTGPEYALESDNKYARAQLGSGITERYTEYLSVVRCEESIPLTATIKGITMYVERYMNNRRDRVYDERVALTVRYPDPAGENKPSQDVWPDSKTLYKCGGASDMWGYAWTPAIINNKDFGGVLSATHDTGERTTCYVDAIWFEVFWEEATVDDRWPSLSLCTDTDF